MFLVMIFCSERVQFVLLYGVQFVLDVISVLAKTTNSGIYTHGKKLGNTSCVTRVNIGLTFSYILKLF